MQQAPLSYDITSVVPSESERGDVVMRRANANKQVAKLSGKIARVFNRLAALSGDGYTALVDELSHNEGRLRDLTTDCDGLLFDRDGGDVGWCTGPTMLDEFAGGWEAAVGAGAAQAAVTLVGIRDDGSDIGDEQGDDGSDIGAEQEFCYDDEADPPEDAPTENRGLTPTPAAVGSIFASDQAAPPENRGLTPTPAAVSSPTHSEAKRKKKRKCVKRNFKNNSEQKAHKHEYDMQSARKAIKAQKQRERRAAAKAKAKGDRAT